MHLGSPFTLFWLKGQFDCVLQDETDEAWSTTMGLEWGLGLGSLR